MSPQTKIYNSTLIDYEDLTDLKSTSHGPKEETLDLSDTKESLQITPLEIDNWKELEVRESHQKLLPNTSDIPSSTNVLKDMRKFYQRMYTKASKSMPKDMGSKRQTLFLLSETIKNRFNFTDISTRELVLYLGSIIYPSKRIMNLTSMKLASWANGALHKAQNLILSYNECLNNFTSEKLKLILKSKVYESLYMIYCQNLEKHERKKSICDAEQNLMQGESMRLLTSRLSLC